MSDVAKWIIRIVCLLTGLGLLIGASSIYTDAVKSSYQEQSTSVINSMTEKARTTGLNLGEQQHHTTDRASISIKELRETARLEVLRASDIVYLESDKDGINVWISAPGNGVFTVDMQRAEIITDEVNNSVSIRIPKPELTSRGINYDQVEKIHFENKKWIFDNIIDGVDRYNEMMKEAYDMLGNTFEGSFFRENAEKNALSMVSSIAKSANPDNPKLKVYVDFFI